MTAFPLWIIALCIIGIIYALGLHDGIITLIIMAAALVIGTLIYLGIAVLVETM
jgi:hypothetical protein